MFERRNFMIIIVIFAVLFSVILFGKIVLNLKVRKKENNCEKFSTKPKFDDKEISLSKALKNFKH
jgi:regulatory protein YycI of two-component signal transduction system YycFG